MPRRHTAMALRGVLPRLLLAVATLALLVSARVTLVPASCAETSKFKVLHVTDIHAWINGRDHLDADMGDLKSLSEHMAADCNYNFLLFDTGDLVDGTGYSDSTVVHGEKLLPILAKESFDGLTMGNHDVEHESTLKLFTSGFIAHWKGKYLTMNSGTKPDHRPFAHGHEVIEMAGQRVLVMGFIFDFTKNAESSYVDPVPQALQSDSFRAAMSEQAIDLIVVLAHITPQDCCEMQQILAATRHTHAKTPLLFLGGHSHRKYFKQLDDVTFAQEGGRYFETIGVMEFDLQNGAIANFHQHFVATTRSNLAALAGVPISSFDTAEGKLIKQRIAQLDKELDLGRVLGCADGDYSPYVPITDRHSLFRIYAREAAHEYLFDHARHNKQLYGCNPFTVRASLHQGKITKNDVWTMLPFNCSFVFFPDVPGERLHAVVQHLHGRSQVTDRLVFPMGDLPDWTKGGFVFSADDVDTKATYDMICAEYDCKTVKKVYHELYPDDPEIQYQTYTKPNSETYMFMSYIHDKMKC